MPKETVQARAKLNLTLDVLGKRPDGYHDLKMVMQSVALSDNLTVETGTGEDLRVRTDLSFLPNNEKNLAAAAALAFQAQTGRDLGGVAIAIEKHIPVCAGMGGETIMGILSRAPWTKDGARLILQPQSKLDELCLWLRENGYGIFDAAVVSEGRRMYIVLLCRGERSEATYAEEVLAASGDPLLEGWAGARIARIEKALSGMLKGSGSEAEADAARSTLSRLEQYANLQPGGKL